MTPETQRQWTQAMLELQDLNDRLVLSDWRTAVDWRTLRVKPPTAFHTAEEKQTAVGGAQRLKPMNDDNGGFAMRLHGMLDDSFAALASVVRDFAANPESGSDCLAPMAAVVAVSFLCSDPENVENMCVISF